jgi:CRISPR-associated protein Csm3
MLAANPRTDQANPFVGLKSENTIDRKTGVASNPRTQEVVPAGISFTLEFCLRVFNGDDAEANWAKVSEALSMLQRDALGASGSRGGGKVKVTIDRRQIYK